MVTFKVCNYILTSAVSAVAMGSWGLCADVCSALSSGLLTTLGLSCAVLIFFPPPWPLRLVPCWNSCCCELSFHYPLVSRSLVIPAHDRLGHLVWLKTWAPPHHPAERAAGGAARRGLARRGAAALHHGQDGVCGGGTCGNDRDGLTGCATWQRAGDALGYSNMPASLSEKFFLGCLVWLWIK